MKTLQNFFLAGLLASVCLAPAVSADVDRALSGRPLALMVRDFATTKVVSSEDRSTMAAALPRLVSLLFLRADQN
ncbi:MAG TPA: hypothetical protein VHU23_08115 [Rhizomicrobium sp.]|jgi:hypothetical protein|nr:hypothetical protein [Rhizomicrobium sp.]